MIRFVDIRNQELQIKAADLQRKQEEFDAEPLIPEPLVKGRDLIDHGLQPGPEFKEILQTIETEQLEGRILDRESALEYLKHLIQNS